MTTFVCPVCHVDRMWKDCPSMPCEWGAQLRAGLLANGYLPDSRCTYLAIGKCSECGRIHNGKPHGVLASDKEQSNG